MYELKYIAIGFIIGILILGYLIKKDIKQQQEERERKEKFKKAKQKEEKKIEEITKERKRKIFEKNRKERAKKLYKENIQKGIEYEKYVARYFRARGYKVKEHGIQNGRKDKGIDIIAKKNNEILLIQCKNWKKDSKRKIDHIRIKEFIGNCTTFIEKNKNKIENKDYIFKKLFITSNKILDKSAKRYMEENKEIIMYMHLPFQ